MKLMKGDKDELDEEEIENHKIREIITIMIMRKR